MLEVRKDLDEIGKLASQIENASGPKDEPDLDGAARAYLGVGLHNYFTAVETMLERIVREIDGAIPEGPSWHRTLLRQSTLSIGGVRPAILDEELLTNLSRMLSFRHFFRHAYAVDLDWDELIAHRQRVVRTHPRLEGNISTFLDHLADTLSQIDR